MKRAVATVATLVAVSTILVIGPARSEPAVDENQFIALINQLRATKGLTPVVPDPDLATVARNWSGVMARDNQLKHNPDVANQVKDWLMLGENVGVGGNVADIHAAFVASPHHYENLVEPKFDTIGVGIVESNGNIWVTENFKQRATTGTVTNAIPRSPRPAPSPAPAPAPRPAPSPSPSPTPGRASRGAPRTPAPAAAPAAAVPVADQVPVPAAPDSAKQTPTQVAGVNFDRAGSNSPASSPALRGIAALLLLGVVAFGTRRLRRT